MFRYHFFFNHEAAMMKSSETVPHKLGKGRMLVTELSISFPVF